MTRRIVLTVMCLGWVVGATVGVVPMFWNNWATAVECEFDEVLPPWYMAGIVTPLFAGVWLCMLVLYVKIWMEAAKQAKQMRASFSGAGLATKGGSDWKSIQVKRKEIFDFIRIFNPLSVHFAVGSSYSWLLFGMLAALFYSGLCPDIPVQRTEFTNGLQGGLHSRPRQFRNESADLRLEKHCAAHSLRAAFAISSSGPSGCLEIVDQSSTSQARRSTC